MRAVPMTAGRPPDFGPLSVLYPSDLRLLWSEKWP